MYVPEQKRGCLPRFGCKPFQNLVVIFFWGVVCLNKGGKMRLLLEFRRTWPKAQTTVRTGLMNRKEVVHQAKQWGQK